MLQSDIDIEWKITFILVLCRFFYMAGQMNIIDTFYSIICIRTSVYLCNHYKDFRGTVYSLTDIRDFNFQRMRGSRDRHDT